MNQSQLDGFHKGEWCWVKRGLFCQETACTNCVIYLSRDDNDDSHVQHGIGDKPDAHIYLPKCFQDYIRDHLDSESFFFDET